MAGYESNATWPQLAQRVRDAGSVALLTHRKPDGDAIGSVLALARALSGQCTVHSHLVGPVGKSLLELAGETPLVISDNEPEVDPDLVILVDTGSWVQVGPLSKWLKARRDRVIGLDHHPVGDDIASERIIDPSAASCTMLVLQLLEELGLKVDGDRHGVGEAIFMGLATDTGWFRHSNADAACFKVASYLLERGVDRTRLYRLLEENASTGSLGLLARALGSLQYEFDGRCAIMHLTDQDFTSAGAQRVEVEGIVNQPLGISGVEASILLYADGDDVTKISLRSKPPVEPGGRFINVSEIASAMGGGGHVHASGARFTGSIDAAITAALKAMRELSGTIGA